MLKVSVPELKIYKSKKNTFTSIKYYPDLKRFNMKQISEIDV